MDLEQPTELRQKLEALYRDKTLSYADMANLLQLLEESDRRDDLSGLKKWFRPDGPYSIECLPKHKAFFDATRTHVENLFLGGNRTGKAQPNWELVMTPSGPVPMGTIKEGDLVLGSDGQPTKVLGVFPQGQRKIYRLDFNDGSSVHADGEHLWKVRNTLDGADAPFEILTTKELVTSKGVWAFPDTPISHFSHKEVKVDPYFLGLLLGDGCLAQPSVTFTTVDGELLDYVEKQAAVWNLGVTSYNIDHRLMSNFRDRSGYGCNPLGTTLKEMGCGVLSQYKKVPEDYKFNSVEVRLSVLQGLMDTDGTVDKRGSSCFLSSSEELAKDVAWLAKSLGVRASIQEKIVQYNGNLNSYWNVYLGKTDVPLFRLTRKKERQSLPERKRCLMLRDIEYVGLDQCTCIAVEAADNLYLTNDFVPTHNTTSGAYILAVCATGLYPDWWTGVRFNGPISAWACGQTGQTTRDTVQEALMGPLGSFGKGMIPKDCIGKITARPGVPGALDTVYVQHVPSGEWSTIGFKSYDQKVASFFGTAKHLVWLDEPCDDDIYNECLIRTMTTNGRIIHTITPKKGLTRLLADYLSDCDLLAGTEDFEGLATARAIMKTERHKDDDEF